MTMNEVFRLARLELEHFDNDIVFGQIVIEISVDTELPYGKLSMLRAKVDHCNLVQASYTWFSEPDRQRRARLTPE